MKLRLFVVDTNVLLHFERLDDPRWAVLCPAPCRFVIASTVIAELDRHKRSSVSRLQRRARTLLPWLEAHDGRSLREDCHLELRATEPHQTLATISTLDAHHPDDRIIATAMELREQNLDAEVVLLTDDTTPRIKARSHGIIAVAPGSELRLAETKTQEEAERDEALDKLRVLQSRAAKLTLHFARGESSLALGPIEPARSDIDIQDAVINESNALGEECTQEYLDSYSSYLRACDEVLARLVRCVRMTFELRNEGTHHAEDVLIEIQWSPPPTFLNELPELPAAPKRPSSSYDFPYDPWRHALPDISSINKNGPSGPDGTDGGTRVTYHVPRIVHHTRIDLDPALLVFRDSDPLRGFSLKWVIHAAHQTEPSTGVLNVQVSIDRPWKGVWRLIGIPDDD